MSELKKCPICHEQAKIGYACGDYFAHCSDGCPSPMCDHPNENTTACSWNDWAKWYEKNRRAQPENSRQHALQTGVCPMCEDCPDGCPVETPHDSRNRQENEPLTLEQLRQMDGEPLKHWAWIEILLPETWPYEMDSGYYRNILDHTGGEAFCCGYPGWSTGLPYDDYGKTWLAYRTKPERSEG